MVAAWETVAAIAAGKDGASAATAGTGTGSTAEQLKHNGKTYAEMNGAERHKLHAENEELFNAMRKQAVDAGLV
jgi:triosephosphate isomerase